MDMTTHQYGLANTREAAGMTGKELLQAIVDGRLPQPPISQTMSFWIAEVGDGFAAFEGDPGVHLLNPMGMVHGGWALTLIDSVAACAAQSLLPAGVGSTTVETKVNFSRPITRRPGECGLRDASCPRGGRSFLRRRNYLRGTGEC
jgi:acyl-coenzyme A thioesterase PaaI-like protein